MGGYEIKNLYSYNNFLNKNIFSLILLKANGLVNMCIIYLWFRISSTVLKTFTFFFSLSLNERGNFQIGRVLSR